MIRKKDGNIQNNGFTPFRLFRLYDPQHIVCDAPLRYRQVYYTALKTLTNDINNMEGYTVFFNELKTLFNLPESFPEQSIDDCIKILSKADIKRQRGFLGYFKTPIYKHRYIYLLIIEACYLINMEKNKNVDSLCTAIVNQCLTDKNMQEWFNRYRELLCAKQTQLLQAHIQTTQDTYIRQTIDRITQHLIAIINYETLPVFNISIIATMSAGKSTFVNALLGNEIFPEANTACTAKITSVYDNDLYNRVTGIALHNGKLKRISNNLSNVDLAEWNGNTDFDRIILEGNLDNITNSKKIVAVYDTPGTNFSGDQTHHDITFDFLKKNKMDVIIYVANAEHLATTDERYLLTELYEKIAKTQNSKVIFIINKADSLDTEKENLSTHCQVLRDEIISIGFTPNSIIIPVSAKYARLFKMALTDKANKLTAKEMRDLITGLSILKEDSSIVSVSDNAGISTTQESSSSITIGNQTFTAQEIKQALYNTGFTAVETALELIASK